jgi:hypothetical protein
VPVYYVRIEVRFASGEEEFRRCISHITFADADAPQAAKPRP